MVIFSRFQGYKAEKALVIMTVLVQLMVIELLLASMGHIPDTFHSRRNLLNFVHARIREAFGFSLANHVRRRD